MSAWSGWVLGLVAPAAVTPVVFLLTFRWVPRWLLPFLLAAPLFPVFARSVRAERDAAALTASLLWAASLALCATSVSMHRPVEAERAILNSRAYAEKTVGWVRTGEGEEGSPARFLPRHALELAVFAALAAGTGGAGALVLGAALLGYMSFYVAALWRLSSGAPAALLLGWPPWAVVRVVAYIAIGTALARPLLCRGLRAHAPRPAVSRGLVAAGIAGVGLDILLKWILAEPWRRILLGVLEGAP